MIKLRSIAIFVLGLCIGHESQTIALTKDVKQFSEKVKSVEKKFITHVTLTTYNPCREQCNDDYLTTANMTKIDMAKLKRKEVKYIAVSRDLLWCLPYNSMVHIEGHGTYKVVDTMNKRYEHCIDIMQHKDEKNFKKLNVKVTKIS